MAVGDASTHTLEEQAEAHPLNSSFKSKQFRNRDNCIKISVSFDDWCQMPVVNERREVEGSDLIATVNYHSWHLIS